MSEYQGKLNKDEVSLNSYTITRIVYEIIKLYMLNNAPEDVGIVLNQKYNADSKKSDILLDIAYNWKPKEMSKVPAIFIKRGDISMRGRTIGESVRANNHGETRDIFCEVPIIVTCVAAQPVAVVENLAEYIKQPLLYFRRSIQSSYGIRHFLLSTMTAPKLLEEGKNNFYIDLILDVTYDDTFIIRKNSLVLKKIDVNIFDAINTNDNFIQEATI